MPMPTDEQIIAAGPWWQKVTFPSGLTVGTWDTGGMYATLCAGVDLRGKTTLDIGCMAGVGTKWLEEQGALADGCDVAKSARAQFALVKAAFGMMAPCHSFSVYNLRPRDYASHVVVMAGVYYHLEHPLLGLQNAWAAASEVLLVEGEVWEGGQGISSAFIPGEYKGDASNWWVPTVACLMAWLEWLPGEKRIVDVTPPGYMPSRRMLQVWRPASEA
jgi:tRNA (mo5U34)-methyltransferase